MLFDSLRRRPTVLLCLMNPPRNCICYFGQHRTVITFKLDGLVVEQLMVVDLQRRRKSMFDGVIEYYAMFHANFHKGHQAGVELLQ